MSNSLNPSNTITSIVISKTASQNFLFVGGTNITPPTTAWSPYLTFVNIFNALINEASVPPPPKLDGKITGTQTINKINNSLLDDFTKKTYVCGTFTLNGVANSPATNIAFIQGTLWSSLRLSFPFLATNTITSMTFDINTRAPTFMYIAGKFPQVTDSSGTAVGTSLVPNFAKINIKTNPPAVVKFFTGTTPIANPPSNYIINSLLTIGTTIYVGGTTAVTGGNAFFASYNTLNNVWTPISSTFPGTINTVVQITPKLIALGGQFTSIGTATNCNNIVFYDISVPATPTWRYFGAAAPYGVSGVAAVSPIYPSAQVFTITSKEQSDTTKGKFTYIYIGGYFVNAGGVLSNSIVRYIIKNSAPAAPPRWEPYISLSNRTGVLFNNYSGFTNTNPGVVYSLFLSETDSLNLNVGGLFAVNLTASPTVFTFNLFRITANITLTTRYNQYYGKTITV
jgi:hypothetical protein